MEITFCPARPAHLTLPEETAFGQRRNRPVDAESDGHGGFNTPGISFEDFSRMSSMQRKTTGTRRLPTPVWAVNTQMLREVIVTYVEQRANFRMAAPATGTYAERLARAEATLKARTESQINTMRRLNKEYLAEGTTPERKKQLYTSIRGLDKTVLINQNAAAVVAGIIWLYYRAAQDSVGVGAELGIRPQTVRQTLFRLHKTAALLFGGEEVIRCNSCVVCGASMEGRKSEHKTCGNPECRRKSLWLKKGTGPSPISGSAPMC